VICNTETIGSYGRTLENKNGHCGTPQGFGIYASPYLNVKRQN
jgi:hypothetical protein